MTINILEAIGAFVKTPDELNSESDRDKFHHFDLAERSEQDLRRELAACRWWNHIAWSDWHQDREAAIGAELRHRHDDRHTSRAS